MASIKLSIITATYNAALHLPRLIESLIAQTDQEFEWVVADGASTDGTLELLESARRRLRKVVVDSRADFGIYDALNRAVKIANGDYYVAIGADDYFFPDAIANFKDECITTNADFVSAMVQINGKDIKYRKPRWMWLHGPSAIISGHAVGTAIKRSLHRKFGFYDLSYRVYADGAFMLNVS